MPIWSIVPLSSPSQTSDTQMKVCDSVPFIGSWEAFENLLSIWHGKLADKSITIGKERNKINSYADCLRQDEMSPRLSSGEKKSSHICWNLCAFWNQKHTDPVKWNFNRCQIVFCNAGKRMAYLYSWKRTTYTPLHNSNLDKMVKLSYLPDLQLIKPSLWLPKEVYWCMWFE